MPLRTKRQHRYNILRRFGFLKTESIQLSKVPMKIPYMDKFLKTRFALFERSREMGRTERQYIRSIKELYKTKGFIKLDVLGRRRPDVWAFFREFEDGYKDKHPEYQSPWVKRQYRFRDFVRKVERADVLGYYKRGR